MSRPYDPFFADLVRELEGKVTIDLHGQTPEFFYDRLIASVTRKYFPRTVIAVGQDNLVSVPVLTGKSIWVNLVDQHVSQNLLLAREWEVNETVFVRSVVQPGQTFVDVGANIGWFTLLAAELVGEAGQVISFEPRPDLFALLKRSVADSRVFAQAELHNMALGDRSTMIELHDVDPRNPGATSLAGRGDGRRWTVRMNRLDDIVQGRPVDFVKIDVEGAELMVFTGASALLSSERAPIVMSEINPWQLMGVSGVKPAAYVEHMAGFGYRCHLIEDGRLTVAVGPEHDFGNDISSVAFIPPAQRSRFGL